MTRMRSAPCEALSSYLLGELTDSEARIFWAHARTCAQCREDLERLMPVQMELAGVASGPGASLSGDLRARTLARAFAARPPGRTGTPVLEGPREGHRPGAADVLSQLQTDAVGRRARGGRRREALRRVGPQQRGSGVGTARVWLGALGMACALVVGYLAGADFGLAPLLGMPQNLQAAMNSMPLHPAPAAPGARGMAMLVKKGLASELIVMVHGLAPLRPGTCYNVWFVSGRHHRLAGILLVNAAGAGALSATVPVNMPISALGISLEPGMRDLQPKGPMVLHARWQGV